MINFGTCVTLCAVLYVRMQELSFQKGDLVLLVSDLLMVRKSSPDVCMSMSTHVRI